MDSKSHNFTTRGQTLNELMITLSILGVTLTVDAPAMQRLLHSSQLRTETSRLLDAINLARSEAVFRNTPVSLCPSTMSTSGEAVCAGDFADGWIIFTNRNLDDVVNAGGDVLIRTYDAVPAGYGLNNRSGNRAVGGLITYLPDGSSRRNLSLVVCPPGGHKLAPWAVLLNTVGRARAAQGEGRCPGGET